MEIYLDEQGAARYLYSEEVDPELLADALGGEMEVRRASHVEPASGGWSADLSPFGGPLIGPFKLRSQALAAEAQWLNSRLSGVMNSNQ